ncbi:hypothetical protein [Paenibacillus macerans]|uniref:hypothetical protein n=1 Tax=Paenibacillus macerans TaxID=44252 RepID=UPI002041D9E9|nr:hypothetical protein [Paenibacillus macerans]MCM3698419.1 hypothetical protein [Paenibacillus macerans]
MRKHCHCGQMMNLGFRLVIFEGIYEIDRVPIYECEDCSYYEVLPEVKTDLTDMLAKLKREQTEERIYFTERNELADLIFGIYRQWNRMETSSFEALLEQQCEEKINLLLDLFGCAKNLGDTEWMDDISKRLAQLSKFIKNRQLS